MTQCWELLLNSDLPLLLFSWPLPSLEHPDPGALGSWEFLSWDEYTHVTKFQIEPALAPAVTEPFCDLEYMPHPRLPIAHVGPDFLPESLCAPTRQSRPRLAKISATCSFRDGSSGQPGPHGPGRKVWGCPQHSLSVLRGRGDEEDV